MAITAVEEFLDLLQKSQLLEQKQFDRARAMVRDGDDAPALAKRLLDACLITDWQRVQLLAGGSHFFLGKYKLLKLLGEGGMGRVYLGQHTTMDRRVALKIISSSVSKEPGSLERFLTEARAIAALDHPNIVQAYSVDNEGDRYYLVMEFVDGEDLEQLVESRGVLDPNMAADYIRQAADGLQHGHQRNMIHCDIKPSNLLLNPKGVVKIVDMGLAQLQDPKEVRSKNQSNDQVLGSVDYLSPEQALGGKDFNHRADIYSLGCTLYFLLTGQPPFPEGMLHEKLMKHQAIDPKSITEFRSDVPAKLVEVCGKMMAKSPDDRYQTAAEVSQDLAGLSAPKLKAKPAAPLKRAAPLTEPSTEPSTEPAIGNGLPKIDTGDSQTMSLRARKTAAGAGPSSSGIGKGKTPGEKAPATMAAFFRTPKQKIIAGAIAAGALLLVVIIGFLLRSHDRGTVQQQDWLKPTPRQELKPLPPEKKPPPPLGYDLNPLGIEYGPWYTTGPISAKKFDEPKFPEEGVDLQAKDKGKPLWVELHNAWDGTKQDLPGGRGTSTYLFRAITAKQPAILPATFGSDDALIVWLNGKKLIVVNKERDASRERDKADLKLNAGENELLVKIHNYDRWAAYYFEGDRKNAKPRKIEPGGEPAPTKGPPLVFDFESGNLQGWKEVKGKFELPVADRDFRHDKKNEKCNKQGRFFLSTVDKPDDKFDDKMTGEIESPVFVPTGPKMSMLVGGGRHNNTYVALCTIDGREVYHAKGGPNGEMQKVEWDIPQVVGKQVYLKVVDHNRGGRGHVMFDDFHAEGKLDLPATEKRLGKEAVAMATAKHEPPGPKVPGPKVPGPGEPKVPAPKDKPKKRSTLDTTGSFAIFNMDEKSGRLRDLSGKEHYGVVRGNVSLGQEGKHGGALRFDGTGGRVIIEGSNEGFDYAGDFTWTAWIKTNTDGTIIAFTREKEDFSRGGKIFHLRDGGKLALEVNGKGIFTSRNKISDDKWHHVALVVKSHDDGENGDAALYIDGKKDGEKTNWGVGNSPDKGDFVLKIGFSNKNYKWKSFNGLIDNVTIFNRELTPEEVKTTAEHLHDPFEFLGRSGGLERLSKSSGTAEPEHVLGKLALMPDSAVGLALLGGEKVVKPPKYYELVFDDATGEGRIYLHMEKQGKPVKGTVARIYIKKGTLGFQWAPKMPPGITNPLLNCGLDITVDGNTRFLQLGRPEIIKPVTITFEGKKSRSVLPAEGLPERELLRLHFVRVDGGFPKPKFVPKTVLPSNLAKITFDKEQIPDFWLQSLFNFKIRPTVEVGAYIDYGPPIGIRPFIAREAKQVVEPIMAEQRKLLRELEMTAPNDDRKKNEINKKLEPVQKKVRMFTLLNEIYSKSKKEPAMLQFRVNMVIDEDHKVTLMQSFDPEKPAAAKDAAAPEEK